MKRQQDIELPFNTSYFQEYYSGYRDKFEDLFPTEKHFLKGLIESSTSVLDVGCASGGMYQIVREINHSINYSGVDIAKDLVQIAKQKYPDVEFIVGDGIRLPFETNSFDSVVSFGTTVHDQDYENLISESYRISGKAFLFDMRIVPELSSINDVTKGYVNDGAGMNYPYVVANAKEFLQFLKNLTPSPAKISMYGYWGKANEYTQLPEGYEKLCMCGILIEKGTGSSNTLLFSDIPFAL
jgi:ubiquinone/menaquinone biosynthesis C-methylase UbiE